MKLKREHDTDIPNALWLTPKELEESKLAAKQKAGWNNWWWLRGLIGVAILAIIFDCVR